jgi:hypothetical protein
VVGVASVHVRHAPDKKQRPPPPSVAQPPSSLPVAQQVAEPLNARNVRDAVAAFARTLGAIDGSGSSDRGSGSGRVGSGPQGWGRPLAGLLVVGDFNGVVSAVLPPSGTLADDDPGAVGPADAAGAGNGSPRPAGATSPVSSGGGGGGDGGRGDGGGGGGGSNERWARAPSRPPAPALAPRSCRALAAAPPQPTVPPPVALPIDGALWLWRPFGGDEETEAGEGGGSTDGGSADGELRNRIQRRARWALGCEVAARAE